MRRADMKCIVIIPDGKIAFGKLAQAVMYGAEIIAIDGNFDDALKIVRSICEKLRLHLLTPSIHTELKDKNSGI